MAKENSTWGYTRIRGALYDLGHEIGRNTIKRILLEAGIDPAPDFLRRGREPTSLGIRVTDATTAKLFAQDCVRSSVRPASRAAVG